MLEKGNKQWAATQNQTWQTPENQDKWRAVRGVFLAMVPTILTAIAGFITGISSDPVVTSDPGERPKVEKEESRRRDPKRMEAKAEVRKENKNPRCQV